MPSQNDGTARPAIARTRMTWSIVFLESADCVPSGIAIRTAIIVAMTATCSDSSSRIAIS